MSGSRSPNSRQMVSRWRDALTWILVICALAAVFALYFQSAWVMQLSQILWTCL